MDEVSDPEVTNVEVYRDSYNEVQEGLDEFCGVRRCSNKLGLRMSLR